VRDVDDPTIFLCVSIASSHDTMNKIAVRFGRDKELSQEHEKL
jgi:hypothetical protein